MSNQKHKQCVFFDRDGVINVSPGKGYVLSWDQFEFTSGLFEVLQLIKSKGWLTALVTSQRCVGKELMTASTLAEIHSKMQRHLEHEGIAFDAIYAYTETPDCPHLPKPDPEMLISASEDLNIELGKSWMIGDSDRDIEMGRAAGLKGCIRFLSDKKPDVDADYTASDMDSLKTILMNIL